MATLSDPATFVASSGTTHLVGVVIEIPQPYRSRLAGMRQECDPHHVTSTPPHVTLVPPTILSEEERAALPRHLDEVAARHGRFDLELRGMASFRPVSPVVFAEVGDGARQCRVLEKDVRTGPLAVQVRFDYHPHVTVAHNVPEPILDRAMTRYEDFRARFPIQSFECFEWVDNDWQLQGVYRLSENHSNRP